MCDKCGKTSYGEDQKGLSQKMHGNCVVRHRGRGFIRNMPVIYAEQFFRTVLCPVDGGNNGIPFALDACADADIFIGKTSFFLLLRHAYAELWGQSVKLLSLVAVKDKSVIKFRYIAKTDIVYFRGLLQRHKHFMLHVKSCLMGTASLLCSIVNSIALNGILDYFAPCFCREMGV